MGVTIYPPPSINNSPIPDWLSEYLFSANGENGAYSPSSSATLTSGIYRYSSMNIPSGVTIVPSGTYLIFIVSGNANINGTLSASGKGIPYTTPFGGGGGGGAGGPSAVMSPSGQTQNGYGSGGAGLTGGAGGVSTSSPGTSVGGNGQPPTMQQIMKGNCFFNVETLAGGAGAGGASISSSSTSYGGGGNGGNGGGAILLIADTITGTGSIRSDGLNGSPGVTTSYGATYSGGGGGGGGGGFVVAIANSIAGTVTLGAGGGVGGNSAAVANPGGKGGNGGAGFVWGKTL